MEKLGVSVAIDENHFDRIGAVHVLEEMMRSGLHELHRGVEQRVLEARPGALFCVHGPAVSLGDFNREKDAQRFDFRIDVHTIDQPDSCMEPGSGGRDVAMSPYPCAFCFERQATDYVLACPVCLHRWSAQAGEVRFVINYPGSPPRPYSAKAAAGTHLHRWRQAGSAVEGMGAGRWGARR